MPMFHGWRPSTSFSGKIARWMSSSGRCLVLLTHVDPRGRVVADEDGRQARDDALVRQRLDAFCDLRADLRGGRLAVEDPGGHGGILPAAMRKPDGTISVGSGGCR